MVEVTIELSEIRDRESFHSVFAEAMGFPAGYGRNLNAWVDSMTLAFTHRLASLTASWTPCHALALKDLSDSLPTSVTRPTL